MRCRMVQRGTYRTKLQGVHRLLIQGKERRWLLAGIAVVLIIVVIGAGSTAVRAPRGTTMTAPHSGKSDNTIDLLNGHWQLAGVTATANRLSVRNVNLAIVQQDGSPGQANPPVNLYGTRLQTTGGFSVNLQLSGITDGADIALYGTPPLIEDEFRAEEGTLSVTIKGTTMTADISGQPDGNHLAHVQYTIPEKQTHTLAITDERGQLTFAVDAVSLDTPLADHNIFSTDQVWFGFEAPTAGSSFQVNQLQAQPLPGGTVRAVDTRQQSITPESGAFATAAQQRRPGFLIGAAVALGPMVADPAYRQLLGNYNAITTENVGKFQFIHPLPGNQPQDYTFADMDAVVAMARKAGMAVHGHALVFGEANPAWVQEVAKDDPSQLKQIMIDHITTVMTHYKGQIEGWDVVNEPLADYDTAPGQYGLRKDIWYNAMGPDYIAIALRAAHAADPAAGLWINDFGMESDDDRFDEMVSLVKRLQAQGVPLTGIGFQAHIDSGDTIAHDTHLDTAVLAQHIQTLQALGLKVRFSEVDVTDPQEYPVFADIMSTCIAQPACVGVTTWGITDKYSSSGSLDDTGAYTPGIGLPWDVNEQPLAPVADIRRALI